MSNCLHTSVKRYSHVHISSGSLFSKILRKPSMVQKKMISHLIGLLVFFEMKKFFFILKKKSKWPTQKNSFSSSANSKYFFMKILWIAPWVSKIIWLQRALVWFNLYGGKAVGHDLKSSILFFLSSAPTAQNSPELNIRFIDSCIQWSVVLYLGLSLLIWFL